jgi:type II secretory pathway pseudopilin PulG
MDKSLAWGKLTKSKNVSGQILIEVIIAGAIIVLVAATIVNLLQTSSRAISETRAKTSATFLAQEEIEAMRAISRENWLNIANLATGTINHYYATSSAGKWVATSGDEIINLNDITYTRYVWFDDVYRSETDGSIVTSGGYFDPSTKKMTVKITWQTPQGISSDFTDTLYLTRFLNETYGQTDWSGGAVGDVVATTATTTFATSSSIDYSNATGSIKLQQQ